MDERSVRRWIKQHPHGLCYVLYCLPNGREKEGLYEDMISDGGQFERLITTLNDASFFSEALNKRDKPKN